MMINALSDMSIQNAESAGSPKSYASARAMIHQKAWYQVMGELASEMVMIVKIVIETLVSVFIIYFSCGVMFYSRWDTNII